MSRTTFEHVWGELVHEGGARKVQLRLTVKEMMVDEMHYPVMRAVARTELLSAVHDGLYKVRFLFDDKWEEFPVRVQGGHFIAP
jgi:hypothetical protein